MDPLDICNQALGQLGVERISSLEDASAQAELCRSRFAQVRDAVLSERVWRFATERRELAAAEEAPAWGFSRRFPLPSVVVRVLEVTDGFDPIEGWKREGAAILANHAGPLFIRSVEQQEDPSTWPASFCEAVAARLGATMAMALTENRSLAADLWRDYQYHLRTASTSDGMQGRSEVSTRSALRSRR